MSVLNALEGTSVPKKMLSLKFVQLVLLNITEVKLPVTLAQEAGTNPKKDNMNVSSAQVELNALKKE